MNRPIFLILFLFTLWSCAEHPSHSVRTAGRKETGQPALHAVRNSRLRELMDRMNNLMQERFLTEPELDAERRKYAVQISSTAQDLSKAINTLPSTLPALRLSAAEQTIFLALVSKLRTQSQSLQEQADKKRLDDIPNTLEQIDTTCMSCHALFRKLQKENSK